MSGRITHGGVVVGVDGSPSSRVAVRWAAREAMMRNVPLTLAHVAAPSAVGSVPVAWPAAPIPEEVLQRRDEDARNIIADAIKVVEDSADSGDRPEINGEVFYGGPCRPLSTYPKTPKWWSPDAAGEARCVVGCSDRSAAGGALPRRQRPLRGRVRPTGSPSARPVREGSARRCRQPRPRRIRRDVARFGQHRRRAGGPRPGDRGAPALA